jgi:hypothetical protein
MAMISERHLDEIRDWLQGRADELEGFAPVVDDMAMELLIEVTELRRLISDAVHGGRDVDWDFEDDVKALVGISKAYRDVWAWWVVGARRIDELMADRARIWDAGFAEGVIDQSRYEVTGDPEVGESSLNPYRRGDGEPSRVETRAMYLVKRTDEPEDGPP